MDHRRPTDPAELYEWFGRQENEAHYREEQAEREARFDPGYWSVLVRCPVCSRPLSAREMCPACGDELDEAA